MRKRVIPYAKANSIYEIDVSFFLERGITTILSDLDNTLDSYQVSSPSPRAFELTKRLKDAGLRFVILSNNSGGRVSKYANELGVEAEFFMKKPFSGPLKKFLKRNNLKPEECVLIGDQIMTDVKAGNGAGVRVIMTEPLDPVEPPWTRFNRIFDRPVRRKLLKRKLVPNWNEMK